MKVRISFAYMLAVVLAACLFAGAPAAAHIPRVVPGLELGRAPSAPNQPVLIDVRAHHRPGFDRVVFVFDRGAPAHVDARYVERLIADPSGFPIRIAGSAVLQVQFETTQWTTPTTAPQRRAFDLPNVMTVVRSGRFEGVTTYGIGLTKPTHFAVRKPVGRNRVILDIRAAFRTVRKQVYFFNRNRYLANREPFFVARLRPVRLARPGTDALDRLFAGPLPIERAHGLRLLRSRATDFSHLTVRDRIARVRLVGGCDSGGSTVTLADEIMPTLRQFPTVDWVKIYGPAGRTADPTGPSDSIPACLNP